MRKIVFVVLFFVSSICFAEDPPMEGWNFTQSVTLNGRTFLTFANDYAKSYREQDGYAVVQGQRLHYWLYDTYAYHNGDASAIVNQVIPSWIEKMGYVIDFDNIRKINPNPSLASSVKALMQQRSCDVSVALIVDEYVVINNWNKKTGVYDSIIYPFYKEAPDILKYFGYTSTEGIVDLGIMSETAAKQRTSKEFQDFLTKARGSRYTYGAFLDGDTWKLGQNDMNIIIEFIKEYEQPQQNHLYKAWWLDSTSTPHVNYVWFGNDDVIYLVFTIYTSP